MSSVAERFASRRIFKQRRESLLPMGIMNMLSMQPRQGAQLPIPCHVRIDDV